LLISSFWSGFLEMATEQGIIRPVGQRALARLTPCLTVPTGNPLQIKSLKDLARPGLRVGLGNYQHACIGLQSERLLTEAHLLELVRPNVVAYPDNCEGTLLALLGDEVDVIIGWTVFEHWAIAHGRIQSIAIPECHGRSARVMLASTIFSREPAGAEFFASYLTSPEGRKIFQEAGYEMPFDLPLAS
jgi:molybdate transport system substrate-binding protein